MLNAFVRTSTLVLVAIAGWLLCSGAPIVAQEPSTAYPLLMSGDRAHRLADALIRNGRYLPGELLVKFRDGSRPADQARALSVLRRVDTAASRWIGDVLVVDTPGEPDAAAAAAALASQPEVEWAQPNYLRRLRSTPNDPQFSSQWNFTALDLPRAWDINPGATSAITVAVIDTGITAITQTFNFRLWTGTRFDTVAVPVRANPDIAVSRILAGRNFVFWNGPVLDFNGHGSHVSGTVLQDTNNNTATAGIAYGATLLPLKACLGYWDIAFIFGSINEPGFVDPDLDGICDDSAIAQAMRFAADQGAQVINVSIGSSDPAPVIRDAMNYAVGRGSFIAIAAGNEHDEGNPVEYPASYAAQIDGAVAVGAVGRSLRRAYYSNTGSYVELTAPGGDDRDGGATGMIWQVTLLPDDSLPSVIRPRFDRYATVAYEGTSMAAPHVAGTAALLYSQGITRPSAIEAALEQFATDLGAAGRDNDFGFGLITPRSALRGMGLVK